MLFAGRLTHVKLGVAGMYVENMVTDLPLGKIVCGEETKTANNRQIRAIVGVNETGKGRAV